MDSCRGECERWRVRKCEGEAFSPAFCALKLVSRISGDPKRTPVLGMISMITVSQQYAIMCMRTKIIKGTEASRISYLLLTFRKIERWTYSLSPGV